MASLEGIVSFGPALSCLAPLLPGDLQALGSFHVCSNYRDLSEDAPTQFFPRLGFEEAEDPSSAPGRNRGLGAHLGFCAMFISSLRGTHKDGMLEENTI